MLVADVPNQLPNYLRAYRKRCGFSQEELAYLVKLNGKSAWSNLERFRRQPSLRTALACEEVFGIPASRLFAGIRMSAGRETTRRMRALRHQLAAERNTGSCLRRAMQKLQWLSQRLGRFIPSPS
ncbi:MAG: helix-turn-helix transcriptional regulator [Acidobacteriia bacterium]|nr:helix-turn-helix transcriptional regulator [Terriglobia bacterium]